MALPMCSNEFRFIMRDSIEENVYVLARKKFNKVEKFSQLASG